MGYYLENTIKPNKTKFLNFHLKIIFTRISQSLGISGTSIHELLYLIKLFFQPKWWFHCSSTHDQNQPVPSITYKNGINWWCSWPIVNIKKLVINFECHHKIKLNKNIDRKLLYNWWVSGCLLPYGNSQMLMYQISWFLKLYTVD